VFECHGRRSAPERDADGGCEGARDLKGNEKEIPPTADREDYGRNMPSRKLTWINFFLLFRNHFTGFDK